MTSQALHYRHCTTQTELTGTVELFAAGDVEDLAIDANAHPAVLPSAIILPQLFQGHVLSLQLGNWWLPWSSSWWMNEKFYNKV